MANKGHIFTTSRTAEATNIKKEVERKGGTTSFGRQSRDRRVREVRDHMAGEFIKEAHAQGKELSHDQAMKKATDGAEHFDRVTKGK